MYKIGLNVIYFSIAHNLECKYRLNVICLFSSQTLECIIGFLCNSLGACVRACVYAFYFISSLG